MDRPLHQIARLAVGGLALGTIGGLAPASASDAPSSAAPTLDPQAEAPQATDHVDVVPLPPGAVKEGSHGYRIPETSPDVDPPVGKGAGDPRPADPASASAAARPTCETYSACSWTGGYYTGPEFAWYHRYSLTNQNWTEPESACQTSGTSGPVWKNCASSVGNTAGSLVTFHTELNHGGANISVPNDAGVPQLGTFNNDIESSLNW